MDRYLLGQESMIQTQVMGTLKAIADYSSGGGSSGWGIVAQPRLCSSHRPKNQRELRKLHMRSHGVERRVT
jgi:hypothetical protein